MSDLRDLERRVKKIEDAHEPSGCGCIAAVIIFAILIGWPLLWEKGKTDFKPFWFPSKISYGDWKEKNK